MIVSSKKKDAFDCHINQKGEVTLTLGRFDRHWSGKGPAWLEVSFQFDRADTEDLVFCLSTLLEDYDRQQEEADRQKAENDASMSEAERLGERGVL